MCAAFAGAVNDDVHQTQRTIGDLQHFLAVQLATVDAEGTFTSAAADGKVGVEAHIGNMAVLGNNGVSQQGDGAAAMVVSLFHRLFQAFVVFAGEFAGLAFGQSSSFLGFALSIGRALEGGNFGMCLLQSAQSMTDSNPTGGQSLEDVAVNIEEAVEGAALTAVVEVRNDFAVRSDGLALGSLGRATLGVDAAEAQLDGIEGAVLDGSHVAGVTLEVGVRALLAQFVPAIDGLLQGLGIDAVDGFGGGVAGTVALDVGSQFFNGVALEDPAFAQAAHIVIAPVEEGVLGMTVVPNTGVGVDNTGTAGALPQRTCFEEGLIEDQEHGQVHVFEGVGVHVQAGMIVVVVSAGGVFLVEALAGVVDNDVVVGLDTVGSVGGDGAVGHDGRNHEAQRAALDGGHVPHTGADGFAHGDSVAGVVGSAPGEETDAGIAVVILHGNVVLIAAAAEDDALFGAVVLLAFGSIGLDTQNNLGEGILEQLVDPMVQADFNAVFLGALMELIPEIGAGNALAAGNEAVLILGGTVVAIAVFVGPGEVHAVALEPFGSILSILQSGTVGLHRSGAVSTVAADLQPLVNVNAAGSVNVTAGNSGVTAVALAGLLQHDNAGAFVLGSDGSDNAGSAVTNDNEVSFRIPMIRQPGGLAAVGKFAHLLFLLLAGSSR